MNIRGILKEPIQPITNKLSENNMDTRTIYNVIRASPYNDNRVVSRLTHNASRFMQILVVNVKNSRRCGIHVSRRARTTEETRRDRTSILNIRKMKGLNSSQEEDSRTWCLSFCYSALEITCFMAHVCLT